MRDIGRRIQRYRLSRYAPPRGPVRRRLKWLWLLGAGWLTWIGVVSDHSLLQTALRESAEEVGLDPGDVEIIGALPERRTLSSQFVVTPFVARIPDPYAFVAEAHEVARIIDAPLAAFRDPARREDYEWRYGSRVVRVPSVRIDGEIVWGLSLAIVDDLLASELAPGFR